MFLYFSQRKRLGEMAEEWCQENGVLNCPVSIVSFLQINGLINTDAALEFLKKDKEKRNEQIV